MVEPRTTIVPGGAAAEAGAEGVTPAVPAGRPAAGRAGATIRSDPEPEPGISA